jgi:hypothetical protein
MLLFHGYAPATAAHKLHRRQFIFTEVRMIRLSRPAEAAFGFIAARIAQVARFVGYCPTVFTCISHF